MIKVKRPSSALIARLSRKRASKTIKYVNRTARSCFGRSLPICVHNNGPEGLNESARR